MIEPIYNRYLSLTGEPAAAAMLTLAEAISVQPAATGPLSVKQAAKALNICERVVRDLVASKELASHKVGNGRGQIRILPRDLDDYRNRERPKFRHV